MGRRRLYTTEEERKAANAEKAKRYYWANKVTVDQKAKDKYWVEKSKKVDELIISEIINVEQIPEEIKSE